jgi:hypothetical protein
MLCSWVGAALSALRSTSWKRGHAWTSPLGDDRNSRRYRRNLGGGGGGETPPPHKSHLSLVKPRQKGQAAAPHGQGSAKHWTSVGAVTSGKATHPEHTQDRWGMRDMFAHACGAPVWRGAARRAETPAQPGVGWVAGRGRHGGGSACFDVQRLGRRLGYTTHQNSSCTQQGPLRGKGVGGVALAGLSGVRMAAPLGRRQVYRRSSVRLRVCMLL